MQWEQRTGAGFHMDNKKGLNNNMIHFFLPLGLLQEPLWLSQCILNYILSSPIGWYCFNLPVSFYVFLQMEFLDSCFVFYFYWKGFRGIFYKAFDRKQNRYNCLDFCNPCFWPKHLGSLWSFNFSKQARPHRYERFELHFKDEFLLSLPHAPLR